MSLSKPVNPTDVRRAAMDLLARREHSKEELARKLLRRFKSAPNSIATIDSELERLIDEGLLSDERFAAAMVRQLIGRGLGPRRLNEELRSKGIQATWQRCTEEEAQDIDWFARAEQVFKKKFAGLPLPQERDARTKERMKRVRFMQYRGFEFDHFMHLLEEDGAAVLDDNNDECSPS
jgi:regulatory protein